MEVVVESGWCGRWSVRRDGDGNRAIKIELGIEEFWKHSSSAR
jgi:hypothetical protein